MSSANSSATRLAPLTPPNICANARGSPFNATKSRKSAPETGAIRNRAVSKCRTGIMVGTEVVVS
jgi:hypothetical protein